MIADLNAKVRDNPDYILPEGYFKVFERDQVARYELPESVMNVVSEKEKVAVELLDEILHASLGFHILEPLITEI